MKTSQTKVRRLRGRLTSSIRRRKHSRLISCAIPAKFCPSVVNSSASDKFGRIPGELICLQQFATTDLAL